MDKHGLSVAIRRVANAALESVNSADSPIQVFCVEQALESLVTIASDYGLADIRAQLIKRLGALQSGQPAEPIEEVTIS
ncbi:hypothetical protein [Aeromonas enteropelogenes]|uniref:hypothetical protein n=1 Tax=Aeromonas enteropelogenes TaxID=29489 RepID=UPI003BA3D56A